MSSGKKERDGSPGATGVKDYGNESVLGYVGRLLVDLRLYVMAGESACSPRQNLQLDFGINCGSAMQRYSRSRRYLTSRGSHARKDVADIDGAYCLCRFCLLDCFTSSSAFT